MPSSPSKSWKDRVSLLLVLAALSFVYFWFTRFKAPKHIDPARLQLTYADGRPLPESLYRGKAVILNFWAPWCGPCRLETPWLQSVQKKHPDDLLVIGIDDDSDTNDQIAQFAIINDVHYPLVATNIHVRGIVGTLAAVPTTLYISRSGQVVHTISGAVPQPLIESFAQDALRR